MQQEPRPCTGCGDDKCLSYSNVERAEHDGPACKVVTCMAQWATLSFTSHVAARTARGAVGRRKSGVKYRCHKGFWSRLLRKVIRNIVKAEEITLFFMNRTNTANI